MSELLAIPGMGLVLAGMVAGAVGFTVLLLCLELSERNLFRTSLLAAGLPLSEVTARLCARSHEFELLHRYFHVHDAAGLQRKLAAVRNPLAVRGHGESARARIGHAVLAPA